jgi:hypothetical protein
MLIKVTNRCGFGCSHCMESSTPKGLHMTKETLLKALEFTKRVEVEAWRLGCPPRILLSGGECTEHPDIADFIETVMSQGFETILITNGAWLADVELRKSLLRKEWSRLFIQVTNDRRFYPRDIERYSDPRIVYIESLTNMVPLGRFAGKSSSEVPTKKAPTSFNLRSLTRTYGDVRLALAVLRSRAASGMSGNCIPTISDDGAVMAGETRNCFAVGTVDSTPEEITKGLINMQCNRCGLVNNLTQEQKRAIGESALYAADETRQ